jgi:hypothetical protein
MIRPGAQAGCLSFGGYKAFLEGYLGIGFAIFDPGNFILVSDRIRSIGVQVDGSDGQKSQRTAPLPAQISTQASQLMVRVRIGVANAFGGRFTAIYPWNFPM